MGRIVLLKSEGGNADEYRQALGELGDVVFHSMICVERTFACSTPCCALSCSVAVEQLLNEDRRYDGLVITSGHALDAVAGLLRSHVASLADGGWRREPAVLATVGERTTSRVTTFMGKQGLQWARCVSASSARNLAPLVVSALAPQVGGQDHASENAVTSLSTSYAEEEADMARVGTDLPRGRPTRVLHPCSDVALPTLREELAAQGILLEQLVLYRTVPLEVDVSHGHDWQDAWIVFFSPSGVDAFLSSGGSDLFSTHRISCCAFGPSTAARMREKHLIVAAVSKRPTASSLAEALKDAMTSAAPTETK